jgi:hypothetical protein
MLAPPAPTISPAPLKVRLALSSRAPEVPARTTLPAVKSLTVADDRVVSPPEISAPPFASIAPVKVETTSYTKSSRYINIIKFSVSIYI